MDVPKYFFLRLRHEIRRQKKSVWRRDMLKTEYERWGEERKNKIYKCDKCGGFILRKEGGRVI